MNRRMVSVLLVMVLLGSCLAAYALPKATYEASASITLEGKLKLYKKTGTTPAYAILTLDEPSDFLRVPGLAPGVTQDFLSKTEIQLLGMNKLNNKRVKVTGAVVCDSGAPEFQREFALNVSAIQEIPPVKTVKMSEKKATLALGNTLTLTARVSPAAAAQTVAWKSSNTAVATVVDGAVTPLAGGKATITATAINGKKASCVVTVVVPVADVALNYGDASIAVGKTLNLIATVTPQNATNKKVTWSSSDKKVATVDKNGKVKAVKSGTALITATAANEKKATCMVTVSDESAEGVIERTIEKGPVKIDIRKDRAIFSLTVAGLPTTFTFSQPNVDLDALEYGYEILFDDGQAEYSVGTMKFKSSETPYTGGLKDMQSNLWRDGCYVLTTPVSRSGNTLSWTVPTKGFTSEYDEDNNKKYTIDFNNLVLVDYAIYDALEN